MKFTEEQVEDIAQFAHECNRTYCQTLGDETQNDWDNAPEWQKDSALLGVRFHLEGEHGAKASHELWAQQKRNDGWKYGKFKDAVNKEHPCLLPFEQLPAEQQVKDHIFRTVVVTFKRMIIQEEGT